jgi:DNA-binding beta-propeller fold protein YncE
MHLRSKALSLAVAGIMATLSLATANADTQYKLLKTIDLPGTQGGHGDWTTFDAATHTVWLSQSPDHNVVVIDAASLDIKHVIPNIKDGNGIALTAHYAFLSDNGNDQTVVVDKRTFKTIATLKPEGKGPNGAVFDPATDTVLNTTDSNDATFFSATPPFKALAHFRLSPDPAKDGPDVGLYVGSMRKIFQPVDNMVDVIDPVAHKVVATWDAGIHGSAKPLVYDSRTNHFLLGTTDKKVLVLDGATGNVVASVAVKDKVDETAIDEGARRAFVGDKAGVVEVIDLDSNRLVAEIPSEKNTHTLTVDPGTHRLFIYRNEKNKVDVFAPAT